jgi:hypothetical protein
VVAFKATGTEKQPGCLVREKCMKQVKVTILSHVWRVLLTLQSDACPQLITVVDHHASLFTAPRLVQPVLRVQNSVDSNSGTLLHTSPFYAEHQLAIAFEMEVRPEPDCTHRHSCTHGFGTRANIHLEFTFDTNETLDT